MDTRLTIEEHTMRLHDYIKKRWGTCYEVFYGFYKGDKTRVCACMMNSNKLVQAIQAGQPGKWRVSTFDRSGEEWRHINEKYVPCAVVETMSNDMWELTL